MERHRLLREHRRRHYRLAVPVVGEQRGVSGAGGRIRTADRLITNQLLYQLSYASAGREL